MSEMEKLDVWAVIELFGHQKLAGQASERVIAGQGFLQVNVPATSGQPAFTRFYGTNAIYAISPVAEEVARAVAERLQASPVTVYIPPWQQLPGHDPMDQEAELEEAMEAELEDGMPF